MRHTMAELVPCGSSPLMTAAVYAWATGQKEEKDLPVVSGNWVNVRDGMSRLATCQSELTTVARAHVRAFEVPEAAGERFIVGAGPFAGQDVVDVSLVRSWLQSQC